MPYFASMTIRTTLTILLILISIFHINAQSIIGSIKVNENFNIESIEKGDSILLVLNQHSGYQNNIEILMSDFYWVTDSTINQIPLSLKRSSGENLIGVEENRKDGTLLLYVENPSKKHGTIKIYKSEGASFNQLPTVIPISGKVLTSFQDSCLNIMLIEKKTSTLKILKIKQSTIISEQIIKIPFKLDSYKDSDIEFLDPTNNLTLSQSFAKLKFFKNGNIIDLLIDEPFKEFDQNQNILFRTTLFRYNLESKQSDIKLFLESSQYKFRTFLIDQFLFKIIDSSQGYHLIVYDINSQKQLIDQLTLPKESYESTEGYYRNGREYKIQKKLLKSLSVSIGYSDQWSPVIIVEKFHDEYIVTNGNFSNNKGGSFSGGSVASIIGSAIYTAVKQSGENPAMCSYTYLVGSPAKSFSFQKDIDYYKKNIDEFEVSSVNKFLFKGYLSTKHWSIGLYAYEKSSELSLVKFSR